MQIKQTLTVVAVGLMAVLSNSVAETTHAKAEQPAPYGSGNFGRWTTDQWGLPAYDYTTDERVEPRARIREVGGLTAAWHQVGNDHFIANAYNHGYVQLYSQDRDYQWINEYDAAKRQYGGGFGYLRINGSTGTTLAMDRGTRQMQRRFGIGYFLHTSEQEGVSSKEYVYAPYGDKSYLHHDVQLENTSNKEVQGIWWEYWGVSPAVKGRLRGSPLGMMKNVAIARPLSVVQYDASLKMLSVDQLPVADDNDPLSIFAAAIDAPVDGFETSTDNFFGDGSREQPRAVTLDKASNNLAAASGADGTSNALFAFRSPFKLAPGQKITLRYVYGFGHRRDLGSMVRKQLPIKDPLNASQKSWKSWLPQASFDVDSAWLTRELMWSAYLTRSASQYEELTGRHVITEGGWYQYGSGVQLAYRDPLQHILPLSYANPWLVREVILYSAQLQSSIDGKTPFAVQRLGETVPSTSCDNDSWLLWAISEYVFATRDFAFLDTPVRWSDGGMASLWEHLSMAYRHQESYADGAHGLYRGDKRGDWADEITTMAGLTETTMVPATLAYVYPRIAGLARQRGDDAFAAKLDERATALQQRLAKEWTSKGWLSRGYADDRQLGTGVIYGEVQPWAILSGALDNDQASRLVANIRRYLGGVGAPPELNGPSKIGSTQSPAANDPDVTERNKMMLAENSAIWIGGSWFAVNGALTWALATLDGKVANARDYAWDELKRNSLAAHADAFPDSWIGTISMDDFCWGWYSLKPENRGRCGVEPMQTMTKYYGQNTHQPAWLMFDTIKLAGFEPSAAGYTIEPRLPQANYSLRLPLMGIHVQPDVISGYFKLENSSAFQVHLKKPASWNRDAVVVMVNGTRQRHESTGDYISFAIPSAAKQGLRSWAVLSNAKVKVKPLLPPSAN